MKQRAKHSEIRILDAMGALPRFTLADLQEYAGVTREAAESVLRRWRESLLMTGRRPAHGGRGRPQSEYRLTEEGRVKVQEDLKVSLVLGSGGERPRYIEMFLAEAEAGKGEPEEGVGLSEEARLAGALLELAKIDGVGLSLEAQAKVAKWIRERSEDRGFLDRIHASMERDRELYQRLGLLAEV